MSFVHVRREDPLPPEHCGYILFCVHFQTNSSLVWKKIQNFDDSFSKPIPVWFGKKLQFWRLVFQTNSSLVWKKWPLFRNKKFQTNSTFLWKNVKKYIFFSFFPNLKLSFALKCQGTDAKSECLMLSLVTLLDYGLMITMTVLIVVFNCHKWKNF